MAIASLMKSSGRKIPYWVESGTKSIKLELLLVQENVSQVYREQLIFIYFTRCSYSLCQQQPGSTWLVQLHTWNVLINTNVFFFIASVEGFTHITEAKPNCGEYCFWFPQFMKIHHIVWMCPLCSCWERNAEITHRIHVQTHSRSHEKWLHVRCMSQLAIGHVLVSQVPVMQHCLTTASPGSVNNRTGSGFSVGQRTKSLPLTRLKQWRQKIPQTTKGYSHIYKTSNINGHSVFLLVHLYKS